SPAAGLDGVIIDSTRRVHLLNCDVAAVDECVSIRATARSTEDILIEEIHAGKAGGGTAIGPQLGGGIRKIDARDCVINDGNGAAIRFKASRTMGGLLEDISFSDIHLREVGKAFDIDMDGPADASSSSKSSAPPIFRNLRFAAVSGSADSAGVFKG